MTLVTVFSDTVTKNRCPRCRHNTVRAMRIPTEEIGSLPVHFAQGSEPVTTGRQESDWRPTESYDAKDQHVCQ